MIIGILLLSGVLLSIGTGSVQADTSGDYTYTPGGATYGSVITGYTGTGGAIAIPASLGGFPVTGIGSTAFKNIQTITSVILPASMTAIGISAFYGCSHLTAVDIPNGVTTIGGFAFFDCTSLTVINIPSSTASIGQYAFSGCTSLTTINVDAGNLNYASVDGALYNKAGSTLIVCPGAKTGTFTVPLSLVTITNYALADCIHLTAINVDPSHPNYASVDGVLYSKDMTSMLQYPAGKAGTYIMPSSVTTVGRYAFIGSRYLTSVTIASGVTAIGDYTFKYCSDLPSVTIPAGVTAIGIEAFANCSSLTSITFLGLVAPTSLGTGWIDNTPSVLQGHAEAGSNFPATGSAFNGLVMGSAISPNDVVPGAPTNLVAQNGPGYVLLNWLAPADPGSPSLSRYDVYRSGTVTNAISVLLGNTAAGTLSYNDTTASPGSSFYYTVKAVNTLGSGPASNQVTGTAGMKAPSAPQNLTVTFGNNNATLTWSPPADNGGSNIISYEVFSADSGGSYTLIATLPSETLSFVDQNGTSGKTYYVSAVNAVGTGTHTDALGKPSNTNYIQAALPPVAAVAVGSALALIGVAVVSGTSETAATIANGFDSVREYLRRFFRLDKIFDFFTDLFKERSQEAVWDKVEKVEIEDKEAVVRPSLFAGFSALEMVVIAITAVFLGLAFMITNKIDLGSPADWLIYVVVAGLAVSLHDLTHRYVAWRFHTPTEYKFWFLGTAIMFITALLFGAVFSTPSRLAIDEEEKLSTRQKALVYGAGPMMSFVMFLVFLMLIPMGGTASTIGGIGASMNLLTATYAMMPFDPLDGKKVYKWKKLAWAAMFVPMLVLYFVLIIFII